MFSSLVTPWTHLASPLGGWKQHEGLLCHSVNTSQLQGRNLQLCFSSGFNLSLFHPAPDYLPGVTSDLTVLCTGKTLFINLGPYGRTPPPQSLYTEQKIANFRDLSASLSPERHAYLVSQV